MCAAAVKVWTALIPRGVLVESRTNIIVALSEGGLEEHSGWLLVGRTPPHIHIHTHTHIHERALPIANNYDKRERKQTATPDRSYTGSTGVTNVSQSALGEIKFFAGNRLIIFRLSLWPKTQFFD